MTRYLYVVRLCALWDSSFKETQTQTNHGSGRRSSSRNGIRDHGPCQRNRLRCRNHGPFRADGVVAAAAGAAADAVEGERRGERVSERAGRVAGERQLL